MAAAHTRPVAKATDMAKVLDTKRLKSLDGVYDVSFGPAKPEALRQRDASKDGSASSTMGDGMADDNDYDDVKARTEMYGYQY